MLKAVVRRPAPSADIFVFCFVFWLELRKRTLLSDGDDTVIIAIGAGAILGDGTILRSAGAILPIPDMISRVGDISKCIRIVPGLRVKQMLFFMHVLVGSRLIWIVIAVGCFWLGILVVLTLNDYASHGIIPFMPGH